MKKFTKLILVSAMCLAAVIGVLTTRQVVNKVNAATIPDGQTLDTTYDEISVSDLTIDGLTNQSMVGKNENQSVSFTKTNANGSLVFKFKYDVVDTTNTHNVAFRVHFDVADDPWDATNCLWIRGDGVYVYDQSAQSNFKSSSALSAGIHSIEFGRLAILNEGTPTGNYYVYYKLDGTEITSVINAYNSAKMDGTMFFNFSELNTKNKVYDANLSYETAQTLSVSDLTKTTSMTNAEATYSYRTKRSPANHSLIFIADVNYRTAENTLFYFYNDSKENWNVAGYVWFQNNQVYIGTTNADGTAKSSKSTSYTELVVGSQHRIEYGRLAVMNGDTFTGKYHVYVKLDGVKLYGRDQAIMSKVADGGLVHVSGNGGVDFYDVFTQETAKEISVSNLKYDGSLIGDTWVMTAQHAHTYDNTDHTTNYSVKFSLKYEVIAGEEHQFHLNNDNWGDESSFIIKGTTLHMGKSGGGYSDITKTLSTGMHTVVFTRVANLLDGQFVGSYKVTLKIDDEVIDCVNQILPSTVVSSNNLFITGSEGKLNTIYDINYSPDQYEEADEISISDLKLDGNPVGNIATFPADTSGYTYTYTATAAHKSVIFKFKYETAKADFDAHQYHFKDGYIPDAEEGVYWLRNDKFYIRKPSSQYVSKKSSISAAGTYNIEIGKLYITGGANTGKYYLYIKVADELVVDYLATSMPDKANLFITGKGSADRLLDIDYDPVAYETADEISIGDLKIDGNLVGDIAPMSSNPSFTYTATAAHKSVVFKFKYVPSKVKFDSHQYHFNDGYIPDADEGVFWVRNDSFFIRKPSTQYASGSNPISELGTYVIEIGKLYITAGKNTGKYYLYIKVDDTLVVDYIASSMPDKANLFITGCPSDDLLYDIDYIPVENDTNPDVVSLSDLKLDGLANQYYYIENKTLDATYNKTNSNGSLVFKFLYDVIDDENSDKVQFRVRFDVNGGNYTEDNALWIRGDGVYLKVYSGTELKWDKKAALSKGLHTIEYGRLAIVNKATQVPTGNYYVYYKVDGVEINNSTIPFDSTKMTGVMGLNYGTINGVYDVNYIPAELDSNVYMYSWDIEKSGLAFTATLRKDFVDMVKPSQVGFIFIPTDNSENTIKVAGRLVASGDNYTVKAAIANIDAKYIARNYIAKLYYVTDQEYTFDSITSSYYNELDKLLSLPQELVTIKSKVFDVTIDVDTMAVTGAEKSGDESSIVLTGDQIYTAYVINGVTVYNNSTIAIGYTTYKVTTSATEITLSKLAKDMVWGGSEHFVETNAGHDDGMTAENLSAMTTELGLTSVRLDLYLDSILDVKEGDVLSIDYQGVANMRGVIDTLMEDGGVEDFLVVLWNIKPYGYTVSVDGLWLTKTTPDPDTQAEMYQRWLTLNMKAVKIACELFPEFTNFETWNEAEINGILVKTDGTDYTLAKKAQILTDLMYYFNIGIKSVNPNAILTTPSICCAQTTHSSFSQTSIEFLAAIYQAINDDVAVTGYEVADKEEDNYFQVINIHPYLTLGTTVDNWTTFVTSFNTLATTYGDGNTEIWVTEFGFAQNRETNCQSKMLSILEKADQIDCLTRFYFYKVHDYTDKIDSDRWGLYNYDGSIKEIGTAVKNYINPVQD